MRVLLIEDEPELTRAIEWALRESEFSVDCAYDGVSGLHRALSEAYDVIVLDLMLPGLSGEEVLSRLRTMKKTPVVVLTARDSSSDKINHLNLGADDYITKPFDLEEFIARLRAVIRRSVNHPSPVISIGAVSVNLATSSVELHGRSIYLTAKEYAVLHLLLSHRGQLVSRDRIYESVYGDGDDTCSNIIDVYIAKLRKKLGGALISTQRGAGYRINA